MTGGRAGWKRRPGLVLSRPPVGCCCGCRSLITPSLCIASSLARFFLTPGADRVCFFALALTLFNLASLLMTSKNKNYPRVTHPGVRPPGVRPPGRPPARPRRVPSRLKVCPILVPPRGLVEVCPTLAPRRPRPRPRSPRDGRRPSPRVEPRPRRRRPDDRRRVRPDGRRVCDTAGGGGMANPPAVVAAAGGGGSPNAPNPPSSTPPASPADAVVVVTVVVTVAAAFTDLAPVVLLEGCSP